MEMCGLYVQHEKGLALMEMYGLYIHHEKGMDL